MAVARQGRRRVLRLLQRLPSSTRPPSTATPPWRGSSSGSMETSKGTLRSKKNIALGQVPRQGVRGRARSCPTAAPRRAGRRIYMVDEAALPGAGRRGQGQGRPEGHRRLPRLVRPDQAAHALTSAAVDHGRPALSPPRNRTDGPPRPDPGSPRWPSRPRSPVRVEGGRLQGRHAGGHLGADAADPLRDRPDRRPLLPGDQERRRLHRLLQRLPRRRWPRPTPTRSSKARPTAPWAAYKGRSSSQKQDRKIGQIPGKEVEFSFPGPNGLEGLGRARLYLTGKRMYSILIVGPKAAVASSSDGFFRSFGLTRRRHRDRDEARRPGRDGQGRHAQGRHAQGPAGHPRPVRPQPPRHDRAGGQGRREGRRGRRWQRAFVSEAGGFKIAMPGKPIEQTIKQPLPGRPSRGASLRRPAGRTSTTSSPTLDVPEASQASNARGRARQLRRRRDQWF